jgi:hypothetical protein
VVNGVSVSESAANATFWGMDAVDFLPCIMIKSWAFVPGLWQSNAGFDIFAGSNTWAFMFLMLCVPNRRSGSACISTQNVGTMRGLDKIELVFFVLK